ncbi:MFS transporter [Muricauda sp. TY007]|uniref:MFS transporter n=1 Tax=Allomuricauda sp. TY007 TaxID=2683200 RepID=UPI0013C14FF0|nr:MFS transporter [Muricauda sp. TY007]NDV17155.1 MFS transporter [Muricauda sp. TY007]
MGKPRIGKFAWILFICCFISNVLAGQVSTLMSVYLPNVLDSLMQDRASDAEAVVQIETYINSIFLLGWTLGGFSWGLISDHIGRLRSFALSLACIGLFTWLIYFVPSWELLVAFRLLAGFGVGGVMVISVTYLSEVWPKSSRNIVIGIVSIGFPVGIFSSGLINILSGWREGFLMGIVPTLLAVVAFISLKESPSWAKADRGFSFRDRIQLFTHHRKELIHGSLVFGSMLIGLWAVFSWYPTWVQSLLVGSDGQQERGLVMMLLGIGGITGGFLSGWVAKTLGVRKAMLLCFSGCSLMAFLLFGLNHEFSRVIYFETALLSLFFGISQGLLSFYIPQLFPTAIRAGATGFCFNLGRIFTTVAVFSLGSMVSMLGGYGNALLFFSVVFVFGLALVYVDRHSAKELATASEP